VHSVAINQGVSRDTPIVEHHTMCSRKEDTMSIGWMPRRCVPKKDVA
jgi:hypothetical protein